MRENQLSYAKEELVAELSSAMLSAHFGIQTEIQNHASYIDSWLKDLTDEDFTNAVKECVKVVNYFLGGQKESEKKQEVEKVA